ncbi:spermatogenesis-associated protein 31D1-like [Cavia porcellus]|uniref:spermatogenesis-associated protein 31D1-like n=1 Tax=Cavia porcellus TaxID=10141 RepID=UPI002FE0ACD8
MQNVLSFLNSQPEPWLSFGSMFLDTEPNYTFLSAAGLLFLPFLCYPLLKPWLPFLWKNKDIQKPQLSVKRRSGTLRGQKTGQGEAEEWRKLLSILKSPSGQHHDITHFRQLLCPDPFCKVCNTTTAKVRRLLSQASLEDDAPTISHLSFTASVRKPSLTPTSAISAISAGQPTPASLTEQSLLQPSTAPPSQVTPLADPLSSLVLSDSVSAEPNPPLDPRVPVDQVPSEPLTTPSCLPHPTQVKETVLQPEALLCVDDRSGDLSTDDFSSAEASFGAQSTADQVEPGSLGVPRSADPALLENDIKKTDDFLMCSEQEKEAESFAKRHEPVCPLTTTRRPESAEDQQCSVLSCLLESSDSKRKDLHMNHKVTGPKNLEDQVEQKGNQFCHHPELLRQSLNPLINTSGDCFSAIAKIFKAYEAPVLPHTPPLFLAEVQPQIVRQSPTHHLHLVQAQGQLQSLSTVLPDPALAQNRTWEMCFHSTQSEVQSLTLSEVRHLEYNMLPKVQESERCFPSVVQKFQEDIGPPAHKLPSVTESPKAQVPVSILPRKLTLSSELREKFEHHFQKKLIEYQWGLFPRAPSVVCPLQTQCPVTAETKSSHGTNHVSLLKSQSSKDLKNFELSQSRFHESIQETLPLQKGVEKRQEHSPETGSKNNQLGSPQEAPQSVLGSDSETDPESHLQRFIGKISQASCVSLRQKQIIKALEVHLYKKSEEICKGHIPDTVNISRHSTSSTLSLAEECSKQIQDGHLASLEGKDSYPNTSRNISFLSYSKEKMLEDHIKIFHSRKMQGLSHKAQESTEISIPKKDPSQPLSDDHIPSSDTNVSGLHAKPEVCKLLRESTSALQTCIVKTPNSVLDGPCPATSPVDKEGQGDLRQSPSSTIPELTGNIQTLKDGTQIILNLQHNIDKASQKQNLQAKRSSPRLPTRLTGAGPEKREKRMSSDSDTERFLSQMTMQLQNFPVCKKAGALKAQELIVHQSQLSNVSTSSKSEGIPERDLSTGKPEASLTTERSPGRTVVPQDLKPSGFQNQLSSEPMFEMENVEQSQAQGLSADVSLASSDLSPKTLFHHDQGDCYEDTATSQDKIKTHMEEGKEPRDPQHVLRQYQDKKFLTAEKRTHSLTLKRRDPGGINAGLGAYQGRERSRPDQDTTLDKTHWSKSSLSLSLERQPPLENLFKNKMKHYFQWFCPSTKYRMQESSKEKTSTPSSSALSRGLEKARAGLPGNSRDGKVSRGFAKFFNQKVQEEHFLPLK